MVMAGVKVVIAMDSFKGSLAAWEACDAAEEGIRRALPNVQVIKLPAADGGEGTVEAFVRACGGTVERRLVTGLFGEPVEGSIGLLDGRRTAVVETASASGLTLVPADRLDPLCATSYGTGELICAALEMGVRRLIVGLGGSGTCDGGMGALEALGVRFYDAAGSPLHGCGEAMQHIAHISVDGLTARLHEVELTLACDVRNPFYGPNGAAYVFAPQKGADAQAVTLLDTGLRNFALRTLAATGMDISRLAGAGAAGGLGGGLMAFCGAQMKPGIELLLQTCGFDAHVQDADVVITGEGKTDGQTLEGKVPMGVAAAAKRFGKPVVCVSGGVERSAQLHDAGLDVLLSIARGPASLVDMTEHAHELVAETCCEAIRLFLAGRGDD